MTDLPKLPGDTLSILQVVHDTMVDGPGLRTTIYCAGCPNRCPGCHNPESWDIRRGQIVAVKDILREVMRDPFADVTFSGGDPMFQPEGFQHLAGLIRLYAPSKTIWCYTGLCYEQVAAHRRQRRLLESVDVLVDGRFVESLRDPDLPFRGSSNQRVIDVKASLNAGKVVTIDHPEDLF